MHAVHTSITVVHVWTLSVISYWWKMFRRFCGLTASIGERCRTQLSVSTMLGITKRVSSFERWITEEFFWVGLYNGLKIATGKWNTIRCLCKSFVSFLNKSVALFCTGNFRRFVLLAFMPQITLRRTLLCSRNGRKRTPVRPLPPRERRGTSVCLYLTRREYCFEDSHTSSIMNAIHQVASQGWV